MEVSEHKTVMDKLIPNFEAISNLIDGDVHYCDIPVHDNIGDILIMQGTFSFFSREKIKIKSVSSCFNFPYEHIREGDVIVFHGGGNFGDIYGLHQKLREKVIEKYKNNRIIILPQTIFFQKSENYQKCCEILSSHKDLHIFVRDEKSFLMSREMSPFNYLMPDMAHNLWPIDIKNRMDLGELIINRKDCEKKSISGSVENNSMDWGDLIGFRKRIVNIFKIFFYLSGKLGNKKILMVVSCKIWLFYSAYMVSAAIKEFSKYSVIRSDRLHGHILACLCSIRNEVLDNSYGKNKGYSDLWTNKSDIVLK